MLLQRVRAPKQNIPQTVVGRNHFLQVIRNYVAEFNPVPPLPTEELKVHADGLVVMLKCDPIYRDYLGRQSGCDKSNLFHKPFIQVFRKVHP